MNTRQLSRLALSLLLAFGLCMLLADPLWACPTCKETLASHDPAGSSVARGYYWSILFMMAMPFTLFSLLGGYFYWEVRKARQRGSEEFEHLEPAGSGP